MLFLSWKCYSVNAILVKTIGSDSNIMILLHRYELFPRVLQMLIFVSLVILMLMFKVMGLTRSKCRSLPLFFLVVIYVIV